MNVPTDPHTTSTQTGRRRRYQAALVAAAALGVAALGGGLVLALDTSPAPTATASTRSFYRSVMNRLGASRGSMMGGSGGWMMSGSGYAWMMGGTGAPGWMRGGSLPGFMMGSGTDSGKVMGSLFAGEPGPRVSPAVAVTLGNQIPAGATVSRVGNRIAFRSKEVRLYVLSSPSMPAESFRIAGMANPTVVVPPGARVTMELINADAGMAHGLVVTAAGASASWMPMMAAGPAFSGSALWFLGAPTSAGMHERRITFTASRPGTYQYLCPVPGHAEEGMAGTFIVNARS
ncbi:MAG: sulfocyanin-like copper-binding protein [Actinomycetota bacterium]|nr:sulfocyanin-like copper-binding protein [Actinomycetota bacterium]